MCIRDRVYTAPCAPFLLLCASHAAASVTVNEDRVDLPYETHAAFDVAALETFDLRLARYHLLRTPWAPPVATGGAAAAHAGSGPASPRRGGGGTFRTASSSSSRKPPGQPFAAHAAGAGTFRSSSRLPSQASLAGSAAANGAAGSAAAAAAAAAAGGAPPVLVFADLRDVGLLRTSDGGAEYAAALEAVDALPAAQRHDACQVRRCAVQ